MALLDFFRINMPYGMKKNANNEWLVFNREYMPLGWNNTDWKESIFLDNVYSDKPVYTKYKSLTEKKILKIVPDQDLIQRDNDGNIARVFFYNDGTNPKSNPEHWKDYFKIIKELSQLERE